MWVCTRVKAAGGLQPEGEVWEKGRELAPGTKDLTSLNNIKTP